MNGRQKSTGGGRAMITPQNELDRLRLELRDRDFEILKLRNTVKALEAKIITMKENNANV
jgi:hypothetical protein